MSYKAIITTLVVKPHPNADRLELVVVESGETVVAGKGTYQTGMKAIYCPEGGELSHEYCHHNNEYRENHGINKDPTKFGYFDEKLW
jgi:predicted RNA-binding protein with EMAP domain